MEQLRNVTGLGRKGVKVFFHYQLPYVISWRGRFVQPRVLGHTWRNQSGPLDCAKRCAVVLSIFLQLMDNDDEFVLWNSIRALLFSFVWWWWNSSYAAQTQSCMSIWSLHLSGLNDHLSWIFVSLFVTAAKYCIRSFQTQNKNQSPSDNSLHFIQAPEKEDKTQGKKERKQEKKKKDRQKWKQIH